MTHDVDAAYALETPEDSVAFYRGWAQTYDRDFAADQGYTTPRRVAQTFLDQGGQGPVLDIGAGTGLVGAELGDLVTDAIDISQEMLDVAGQKGIYRQLYCADLTQPLAIPDDSYAGMVSAGTFTHGHVGPACLPELIRIARPQALMVFSINTHVFDTAGFGSAFADLVADGRITPIQFQRTAIYEGADHAHADDTSLLAMFRCLWAAACGLTWLAARTGRPTCARRIPIAGTRAVDNRGCQPNRRLWGGLSCFAIQKRTARRGAGACPNRAERLWSPAPGRGQPGHHGG